MFEAKFQSFDETSDPSQGAPRLAALRARLATLTLDGFLLPRADEHQNEYLPPSAERVAWLTGFTGSYGFVVVLADRAALFVDGRYTVQARTQVDASCFTPVNVGDTPPTEWLKRNLKAGARVGYDPMLHTLEGIERLEKAADHAGAALVAVETNPVDAIWSDRPAPPLTPVVPHDPAFAGETVDSKLGRIVDELARARADALLVTDAHALAWAFNIRGSDVAHTPLPLGFAIIPAEGRATVFLDGRKLSNAVRADLEANAELAEPAALDAALGRLSGKTVRVDASGVAAAFARRLEAGGARLQRGADPIAKLKAVKNPVEIDGARAAHLRDGAALCRFLAWLDAEAPKGTLDEIGSAEALESFRRETGLLRDVSFPSISAAGQNAALPHYRVTRASNARLTPGYFLIDSGAQYEDGTTDVTRTVVIGQASDEMKDRFTRVLKGHIAISTAVFPKGVSGAQIDAYARRPLWEAGLDFDHGVGHGVGSYLSVHEGPQRISKLGTTPLEPGMILSNEPGYYKEGHYGIRTETLVLVERRRIPGAEREMYGFETLTLAPIDRRAIVSELLTAEERAWLDAYHARVLAEIGRLVDPATAAWLEATCAPL
ncbi:Xaa-Pro aminopeptidase [Methylopila capsulata]|uniref:Aminopeptidase n=1 Tax=Methylopila capsulata TaxID=61654 RepID=A0A9W6MTQ0_9HYPH|nr:aminopeptidase P family protein [Methylopila capsulata]MBM7853307.1 Xaa-Pro aminopeptidase [Methylopila capsulata]GLK57477.1 aminopeptidase [Methylopila capsulata]